MTDFTDEQKQAAFEVNANIEQRVEMMVNEAEATLAERFNLTDDEAAELMRETA